MKKSILITGSQGSGKSTRALQLAMMYEKDEVEIIEFRKGFRANPFRFTSCTQKTKLIIIDGFYIQKPSIEELFNQLHNFNSIEEVEISKPNESNFWIKPQFIVVCGFTSDELNKHVSGASYSRRFAEINCDKH